MTSKNEQESRRQFLKTTGLAAAGTLLAAGAVHAAGTDTIKVGIIGCGGRGSGAGHDVLRAAKGVEIIALGDYFKQMDDRGVIPCRKRLSRFASKDETVQKLGNKVNIPDANCHVGLDAYEKVINTPGVNYVILATSPGFRPLHLHAAISAGKNVFTEKPVAVDGPGIRKVLDAYEEAKKKKLGVGAGTQRRHQTGYLETMKRIKDGAIGKIVAARCYWNNSHHIWFRPRKEGMTDLDYQIHNWYHFLWLCGDHIDEQHVHNLDVVNWATGQHPLRCLGFGGRVLPYRDPNVDGNIYNFFAIDYEYPDGVHVLSTCRQVEGCENSTQPKGISGVSEALVGVKGSSYTDDRGNFRIQGASPWKFSGDDNAPYVQEHTNLIASIRKGEPINELKNVAQSTLTAIMGRMAAYTGKAVTWEQALNSKLDTMPKQLSREMKLETAALPVPGKTRLI